ncbi:MAG: 4-hydroxyphenylpyruvate dioxygenase [Actinocatenispora sp.]
MHLRGIDHVEFYVEDLDRAAEQLTGGYGFRTAGRGARDDERTLLLAHGGIRLLLTVGLTEEHPATRYTRRHGDGVAVIAFGVDDADEALRTLLARGATASGPVLRHGAAGGGTVATAELGGFGDITHRIVQRSGARDEFWPGRIRTEPDTGPEPDHLLEVIDHFAGCVPAGQLDDTISFYQTVFGLTETFREHVEVGGQGMESKVVQSPARDITFTLIEPDPTRRRGQIDDFLDWHGGAGIQHIAFRTADIVTAVSTFASRGVRFLAAPGSYYDVLAERIGDLDVTPGVLRELGVLVDRDFWGQMYQIFAESVHPRRTYFVEVIDRHGALTFGSGNIKALYEAKERELSDLDSLTSGTAAAATIRP